MTLIPRSTGCRGCPCSCYAAIPRRPWRRTFRKRRTPSTSACSPRRRAPLPEGPRGPEGRANVRVGRGRVAVMLDGSGRTAVRWARSRRCPSARAPSRAARVAPVDLLPDRCRPTSRRSVAPVNARRVRQERAPRARARPCVPALRSSSRSLASSLYTSMNVTVWATTTRRRRPTRAMR